VIDSPYSRSVLQDAHAAVHESLNGQSPELVQRKLESTLRAKVITVTHKIDFLLQHRKLLLRQWQSVAKGIDGNGPTPLDMLINEAPPASQTQELSINLEDSESEHEEVEIITAGPAE
jgi:hypothetical protein